MAESAALFDIPQRAAQQGHRWHWTPGWSQCGTCDAVWLSTASREAARRFLTETCPEARGG